MIKWINKKRNKKGFTLIELVVVIAILGILAAIAIPRLGGFREDAQKNANKATARTIASAVSLAEATGYTGSSETAKALDIENHLDGIELEVKTDGQTISSNSSKKWTIVFKNGEAGANIVGIYAPEDSTNYFGSVASGS